MSTDLIPFDYGNHRIRIVTIDGDPWFVAADVCAVLDLADVRQAVERLDQDDRCQTPVVDAAGRMNPKTWVVSESGLYDLIIRSDKPEARPFRRWITTEVIPAIRKTGGYSSVREMTRLELIDMAREAEVGRLRAVAERDALAPAAEAWDQLVDTGATLDVGAAAKKLRENGVLMGRTRLYAYLREIEWVFARATQPIQKAVDAGWVTVDWGKQYVNPKTKETEQGAAKTRVTAKGMQELLRLLAPTTPSTEVGEAS